MRKILSLAMASAMVLSMASVAFAATTIEVIDSQYYAASDNKVTVGAGNEVSSIGYGKTAYYVVNAAGVAMTKYDDAKALKVKPQWTQNGDLVESVNLVKMRDTSVTGAAYYLAVAVKAKDTTSTAEIAGKIGLSVKTGYDLVSETLNPFITVGYTVAAPTVAGEEDTTTLGTSDKLYAFKGAGTIGKEFAETDEFVIELEGGAGTFTVDTNGQGKILLSSSVKYNEGLEATYPDANYVYINGNGKSFNKTGELVLPANEGDVLYQVKNGKLSKVNVEYDEYEEAFIVKTRTLGTYVIAEGELDLSAQDVVVEAPATEAPVETVNPGTGVAL